MSLKAIPLDLGEANALVTRLHRHHGPTLSHKFSIGAVIEGRVCGAVIVGRPTARRLDDGLTCEVLRLVTDGTPNACSFLYRAAWRCAREMGYRRGITFILAEEPGASLRGAGWQFVRTTPGRSWNVPSRPRVDKHPLGQRLLFEVTE